MRYGKLYAFVLSALFLAACAHVPIKGTGFKPAGRFYYSEKDFLNYETAGGGPVPVIFLHGFGASLHVWDGVVRYMPKDRFTIYLLDLKILGCGPFRIHPKNHRNPIA